MLRHQEYISYDLLLNDAYTFIFAQVNQVDHMFYLVPIISTKESLVEYETGLVFLRQAIQG